MSFIEWTDELSIGIKEIDEQHKNLIELANSLCKKIELVDNHDMVQKAFDIFITQSKIHYKEEEDLMTKHNYPRSGSHIGEHNELLQKVKSVSYLCSVNDQTVISSLTTIFSGYFTHHFHGEDKSLAIYLNSRGVT